MAKAKKLKVYRTAIGFHDAYVAAPSQKAALEAWGSDSNLFARRAAELVTDPKLTKAPPGSGPGRRVPRRLIERLLERPGEVIKVSRGGAAEQIRALGETHIPPKCKKRAAANDDDDEAAAAKQETPSPQPSPAGGRGGRRRPRPSRAAVDRAERALERADQKHREAVAALKAEEEAIARRRRELDARHRSERERLEQRAESAREEHSAAMAEWAEE